MMKKDDPKQKNAHGELKNEIELWKNKYLRALADYQNLEKRVASQKVELVQYATESFIKKLLPAIDILEKASIHMDDPGLDLALKQLYDVFKTEQLEKIEVLSKPFDPITMECVEVVECDKNDIVLEEIQKGYTLAGKIIRIARVKVGKKKTDNIDIKN